MNRFCHYELRTTDVEAARAFYGELLGAHFWGEGIGIGALPQTFARVNSDGPSKDIRVTLLTADRLIKTSPLICFEPLEGFGTSRVLLVVDGAV